MTVAADIAAALLELDAHIEDVRLALVECGVDAEAAPTAILGDLIRTLAPAAAPFVSVNPVIHGPTIAGETLTASTGTWGGTAPITYAYQWYLEGVAVLGETAATYETDPADFGDDVHVRVTATNASGSAFANSAAVTLAEPGDYDDLTADTTVLTADTTVLTADHEAA